MGFEYSLVCRYKMIPQVFKRLSSQWQPIRPSPNPENHSKDNDLSRVWYSGPRYLNLSIHSLNPYSRPEKRPTRGEELGLSNVWAFIILSFHLDPNQFLTVIQHRI